MATAKKGLIDQAVDAVSGLFQDEPARKAPVRAAAKQPASKKPGSKSSIAKKGAQTMDRKLVSTMEDYEVKYLAQKHFVTQKAVKAAVAKVGHSRNKVEAELKKGKTA